MKTEKEIRERLDNMSEASELAGGSSSIMAYRKGLLWVIEEERGVTK